MYSPISDWVAKYYLWFFGIESGKEPLISNLRKVSCLEKLIWLFISKNNGFYLEVSKRLEIFFEKLFFLKRPKLFSDFLEAKFIISADIPMKFAVNVYSPISDWVAKYYLGFFGI